MSFNFILFFFITGQMASNKDNSENVPQGDVPQDTSDKDITRDITIMRRIIRDRDRGITYNIDWNNDDQLIGSNSAKLTSYIGTLVRMHISITTPRWKKGELDEAKEKIWTEINVSYMVVNCYLFYIDDNVFKLHILTPFMRMFFCRGPLTLKMPAKII